MLAIRQARLLKWLQELLMVGRDDDNRGVPSRPTYHSEESFYAPLHFLCAAKSASFSHDLDRYTRGRRMVIKNTLAASTSTAFSVFNSQHILPMALLALDEATRNHVLLIRPHCGIRVPHLRLNVLQSQLCATGRPLVARQDTHTSRGTF